MEWWTSHHGLAQHSVLEIDLWKSGSVVLNVFGSMYIYMYVEQRKIYHITPSESKKMHTMQMFCCSVLCVFYFNLVSISKMRDPQKTSYIELPISNKPMQFTHSFMHQSFNCLSHWVCPFERVSVTFSAWQNDNSHINWIKSSNKWYYFNAPL